MNTPTREEVSRRASQLWVDYGRPAGRDVEIWVEAEKQVSVGSSEAQSGAAVPPAKSTLSESQSEAALAEVEAGQKHLARAQIAPTKSAPRTGTPQSGKPLWNKPHSS